MFRLVFTRLAKLCPRVALSAVLLVPAIGAADTPLNQFEEGAWDPTVKYQQGNVVTYQGSSYVALDKNSGIAPNTSN